MCYNPWLEINYKKNKVENDMNPQVYGSIE